MAKPVIDMLGIVPSVEELDTRTERLAAERRAAAWRRLLVVLPLSLLSLGACCGDSPDVVELSLTLPASVSRDSLRVGDTLTVWAGAVAGTNWPSCMLYASRATPGYSWRVEPWRFAFHSSDTTIAAVGSDGFLTAVRRGETVLTATSAGASSAPLFLKVSSP